MKSTRRIRWAGVEFQADLQNPRKPVRLGVVLLSVDNSGESSVLILGRKPSLHSRPPEFNNVSTMTLELAASWLENMAKDILETDVADPFERLSQRWRWNLYLMPPANVRRTAEQQNLVALAKQTYERFVGERVKMAAPSRTPRRATQQVRHKAPPSDLPPAWLVEEITRRLFSPGLAATA